MSEQVAREIEDVALETLRELYPEHLRVGAESMFLQTTQQTRMAICISDPHLPDCPVVYVNQAFVDLTGYQREDILGRNCRFLQGPDTDRDAVARLRDGIAAARYIVVDLLNYKKDGTPFWNAVHVGPIYDDDGNLAYFYGSQWDITELQGERQKHADQQRIAHELRHRTDNIFAVLNAIVGLTSRRERDVESFAGKLSERIQALAAAHRMTIVDEPDQQSAQVASLVDAVMKPYRNRFAERISAEGPAAELDPRSVTALGLTLHELATNAIKYGALSVAEGRVSIVWQVEGGDFTLEWRETGGPALPGDPGEAGGGTGTMLIDGMVASLKGTVERDFGTEGLSARLVLPLAGSG